MSLSVNIEKRLGDFHLQVQFHTDRDLLALLGASGAGKSLCLRCIAGLVTPDRGRIVLNGRTLYDSAARIDLKPQARRVGYLFQRGALFPHMTVSRNIRTALRAMPSRQQAEETGTLLETFRLTGLKDRYPAQLSGGEAQRAALARSLAARPELLLLDEPFSALDDHLKWDLELSLRESLRGYGGDVILVTHSMEEVCRLAKSVCVLDRGSSQPVIGTQTLLRTPPTLAAARLAGVENLSPVTSGAGGLLADDWSWLLPVSPGPEVTHVGVGAGDLTLVPGGSGLSCRVEQQIDTVSGRMLLLRTPGAGFLRLSLPHDAAPPQPGTTVSVSAPTEALLLLTGGEIP